MFDASTELLADNYRRTFHEELSGRGLDVLAQQLLALANEAQAANTTLEIHFVGHSAGSFVVGRMLTELAALKLTASSCTLFAPACDLRFALTHYRTAVENGCLPGNQFMIHTLSDKLELDDSVGPYRKSLLYLVSRALERVPNMPLLGMAKAYGNFAEDWDASTRSNVRDWQNFFTPSHGTRREQTGGQVDTGAGHIDSSHGCFDNSQFHIKDALERIRGAELVQALGSLDY